MKRKSKPKSKTKPAPNLSELARLTGISRNTLRGFRTDGCPAFKADGTADVPALLEWAAANGRRGAAEGADMKTARLRILQAKADEMEDARAARRRGLIEFSEVETFLREHMSALFGDLAQIFVDELPPTLAGLDAPALSVRCAAEIKRLKQTLRARHTAFLETKAK